MPHLIACYPVDLSQTPGKSRNWYSRLPIGQFVQLNRLVEYPLVEKEHNAFQTKDKAQVIMAAFFNKRCR